MKNKHSKKLHIPLRISVFLGVTFIIPLTSAETTTINTTPDPEIIIDIPTVITIQDLINQATPNSTIQLSAGIYTEILTIDKPLHLKGEGASRTFISTTSTNNGYAIIVNAKEVTLSDIDITNKGTGLYTSCVKISASNTTIQNCTFHDTPIGLVIWSSQNTISGCEFRSCNDEGILLLGTPTTSCSNNIISCCNFYQNRDGIEVQYSTDNLITACSFIQNIHAGIDAIESNNNNNIVSYCKFTNNLAFGFYLHGSSHNMITQCSFSDDIIKLVQASDNTLLKSQIAYIDLVDNSSLSIEQCKDINISNIISQQSSFNIRTDQSEMIPQEINTYTTVYYSFFLTMLSRFIILRQFLSY